MGYRQLLDRKKDRKLLNMKSGLLRSSFLGWQNKRVIPDRQLTPTTAMVSYPIGHDDKCNCYLTLEPWYPIL